MKIKVDKLNVIPLLTILIKYESFNIVVVEKKKRKKRKQIAG